MKKKTYKIRQIFEFWPLTREKTYFSKHNAYASVSCLSEEGIKVFRENSTNTIFVVTKKGGICQLNDPETGLPLTYDVWLKKYYKEDKYSRIEK